MVDHRDRNPLNNIKNNLRLCTCAENSTNREGMPGTSKYRGVFRCSDGVGWIAAHTLNRKSVYIGYFRIEEVAAAAAREWRRVNMPFSVEPCDG